MKFRRTIIEPLALAIAIIVALTTWALIDIYRTDGYSVQSLHWSIIPPEKDISLARRILITNSAAFAKCYSSNFTSTLIHSPLRQK